MKGLSLRILGRLLLKVREALLRWRLLLLLVKVRKTGLLLLLLLPLLVEVRKGRLLCWLTRLSLRLLVKVGETSLPLWGLYLTLLT